MGWCLYGGMAFCMGVTVICMQLYYVISPQYIQYIQNIESHPSMRTNEIE